jgi:transcriptional regulator GlxA family with amidase domain
LPLFAADGTVTGLAGVLRPFDHAGNAPDEYQRLTPALEYALAHYRQRISVEDLAGRVGLSASQLQREFRRLFGMSVGDYLLRLRILMAQRRLRETADAIGRIATDCGFYDQSHFTRAFKAHTGLPPQQFRRLGGRPGGSRS